MRINSKLNTQHATYDGSDAGEGLAIFFSQNAGSVSRFRFLVKAITSQQPMQVGVFYSSPPSATTPTGPLTRMIAAAVCPGAIGWAVEVTCADLTVTPETADIVLVSSKCCTAPVGVTRVGERYTYLADSSAGGAPIILVIPPGRVIKSWSAIANGVGDGFVQAAGFPAVGIPNGFTTNGEPGAPFIGTESITFTNVTFFIEFLESA